MDARFGDRRTTLTYEIPPHMVESIGVGQLVWAPLKKGLSVGVVCEIHGRPLPDGVEARPIHAPVEPTFRLSEKQWALAVWIAEETICSLFEAASVMFPPGVETRGSEHLELISAPDDLGGYTVLQRRLIEFLDDHPDVAIGQARRALGSSLSSVVPALESSGILRRVVKVRNRPRSQAPPPQFIRLVPEAQPPPERAHKQREAYAWLATRLRARPDQSMPIAAALHSDLVDRPILHALAKRGAIAIESAPDNGRALDPSRIEGPELTDEQRAVWSRLRPLLQERERARVLLHGVTGSGKTEIYFRAATSVMAAGRSAILLVPEIALASQVIERATERFGAKAVILHSAMNDRERYDNWNRCASGEPVIVVGPRSALFAPLPDIGLIVVDEEHEGAYKQDRPPRYHARSVATRLAELHDALLIAGSATPDVESYFHTQSSDWRLMLLSERVGQRTIDLAGTVRAAPIALPEVRIVDMRSELRAGNASIFSRHLHAVLESGLSAGEQTILFLNRRGASTMVQCRSCGYVATCPYCDIPMVYHRAGGRLICHRCGNKAKPPTTCPACSSASIGYYGAGTQRVETEVQLLFPQARVLRWDQDVLRGGVTHETLLRQIARHDVDIVVGTQMVSKGLDLPDVTAVGVINADSFLHLPDFRSTERTFQTLTQVAGRAGRRAAGSQVIVQSYSPEHYAIQAASRHDYTSFYRDEIAFRKQHGYPPYKRLVRMLYRHQDEVEAQIAAEKFAGEIETVISRSSWLTDLDLLGPAPAFAARLRGRYGWQILLRGDSGPSLMADMRIPFGWVVDVDPVSLL
ncbi:primosomal protein N' [soil metagenome]